MRNESEDDAAVTMADELVKPQTGDDGEPSSPCPALLAAHEPALAAPSGPGQSPRNAGQHEVISELVVIARLTVALGEEDAILAALPRLIAASQSEPGNLAFEGYRSISDPRQYLLFERYASRTAFNEHLAAPHYREIAGDQIVPRLESRIIEEFDTPSRHD
jgi:quinol monooxygenase YgiN